MTQLKLKEIFLHSIECWVLNRLNIIQKCLDNLSFRIVNNLHFLLEEKIEEVKEESLAEIREGYRVLHQELVSRIIQESREEFRRKLLEKIRESGAKIFNRLVQEHLISLLLRIETDNVKYSSGFSALPYGTRFFYHYKVNSVYVIEQLPQVRTVRFQYNEHRRQYRLAFPFVVFIANMERGRLIDLFLFYRNSPLEKESDELYCPALPNIKEKEFRLCFPFPEMVGAPAMVVNEAIQNFWGSTFKTDEWSTYFESAQHRFPQLSSLNKWEKESEKNPLFVLELNWKKTGISIKEFIEKLISDGKAYKNYIPQFAERVSQKIEEVCFFLVPHWGVNEKSMEKAEKKMKDVLDAGFRQLRCRLESEIDAIFSKEKFEQLFKLIEKETAENVKNEIKCC